MKNLKNLNDCNSWDLKAIGTISHELAQKVGNVMYDNGKMDAGKEYRDVTRVSAEHIDMVCKQWLTKRRRMRRGEASTE